MGQTNRLNSISSDRYQPLFIQTISLAGMYCGSISFDSPYAVDIQLLLAIFKEGAGYIFL